MSDNSNTEEKTALSHLKEQITKETYLGDGLFASFDGFQIKLRAPRENGDHEVFLEPSVMSKFRAWEERLQKQIAEYRAIVISEQKKEERK